MKIQKILIILPLVLLLAGCASDSKRIVDLNLKYITANSAPLGSTDTNAQSQLAEASSSVSGSLQKLSAIQMATHPKAKVPTPVNPAQVGMAQITSVNWTGPVAPLVKRIAQASHYRVRILGSEPAVPTIISVNMQNKPLAEILRNVRFQAEQKVRIRVYPSTRVIELRYYGN